MTEVNPVRRLGEYGKFTRSQIVALRSAANGLSVGAITGGMTEPVDLTAHSLVRRGLMIKTRGTYRLTERGQAVVKFAEERGTKW